MHNFYFKKPSKTSVKAAWTVSNLNRLDEIDLSCVYKNDLVCFYPFQNMKSYLVILDVKKNKFINYFKNNKHA